MFLIHLFRSNWENYKKSEIDFYIKGWAEYEQVVYYNENLMNLVVKNFNYLEIALFKEFLISLNGNFSIIIHSKYKTILCVDKLRCFPILYFQYDDVFFITDDIDVFVQKNPQIKLNYDDNIIEQYLCSNYIFGPYTIYDNVFSVQSGEFVEIENKRYIRNQYFKWQTKMQFDELRDFSSESSILDKIYTGVIDRMIKSAPKVRNWIIPLSGGYDSRIITNYLYKSGVKNVICYSYGLKKNLQSIISQRVAKALGYDWYFIEYTPDTVLEVQQSNEIFNYRKYAFNGTSTPHIQDFIAVYVLNKMGIIQSGDIFVPGHSHDFIAGSHLKSGMELCNSINTTLTHITKHYVEFGYAKRSVDFINHVFSIVLSISEQFDLNNNQIPEFFNWHERQTKYIVNSVKVYEYFGYNWRIPLWDNELINYWSNIGFNFRCNRNLFFSLVKSNILYLDILKKIPFANNMKVQKPFKSKIADLCPLYLKKLFRYLNYSKSTYYVSEGLHLFYSDQKETIEDFQKYNFLPVNVKNYLSNYPKKMKLRYLPVNSVSTLLIIKELYKKLNINEE